MRGRLTFCIHENVKPSAEKQGYVIRRLLRRAVLDAYQMGRIAIPFLFELVPVVADVMGRPYPELKRERPADSDGGPPGGGAIPPEPGERPRDGSTTTFRKTRAAGAARRDSGKDAFTLHATHGIPVEVVESLAADQNLGVDMARLQGGVECAIPPRSPA